MLKSVSASFSQNELSKQDNIIKIAEEHNIDKEEAIDIALEVMDRSSEDVKHLLSGHYELIDSNPRSIKRLANEFTLYRNLLTAEEKDFNTVKLFRWIILQNKYPAFTDWLIKNWTLYKTPSKWPDDLKPLQKIEHWKQLLKDESNKNKEELTEDDITLFTNISVK